MSRNHSGYRVRMSETYDAPAEIVIDDKRRLNGTGLSALIVVSLAYLAPIGILVVGFILARDSSENPGSLIVGTIVAIAAAVITAVGLDIIGIILGIIALFRKNRGRVLAWIAIILGALPMIAITIAATVFGDVISGAVGQL